MKRIGIIVISLGLMLVSVFTFVGVTHAQNVQAGDTITVAPHETVDNMLFAGGKTIDIAGTVNGDVYCAGQNITISGTVHGDVFCAGQTVTISGTIEGSARVAGQNVTLSGSVANSMSVAAQNFVVEHGAMIGRDVLGAAQVMTLSGTVGRDMTVASTSAVINGAVTRNIHGEIQALQVGSTGVVGGTIDYTSRNDPVIASGGQVNGQIHRTVPTEQPKSTVYAPLAFMAVWFVYILISMLILSLLLVVLFARPLEETTARAISSPGRTILVGFVALIVMPVVLFLLFISAIGAPIAILASFLWFAVLIVSGPFAGYLLGRLLLHRSARPVWTMLAGTSLLLISYFIPLLGFLTMLVAAITGTGMILLEVRRYLSSTALRRAARE
jgi:cytoskeletal protein CcmA (bactofilin family)